MASQSFKASALMNPFFPDSITFGEKGVTFTIKKFLRSNDNFVFYGDISGVEIDNGIFFSTIRVLPRMRPEIVIQNFGKRDALKVKELILQYVQN
jgi:hypothetical protein